MGVSPEGRARLKLPQEKGNSSLWQFSLHSKYLCSLLFTLTQKATGSLRQKSATFQLHFPDVTVKKKEVCVKQDIFAASPPPFSYCLITLTNDDSYPASSSLRLPLEFLICNDICSAFCMAEGCGKHKGY